MAFFENENSSNDITNNVTMSDDEEIASDLYIHAVLVFGLMGGKTNPHFLHSGLARP